VNGKREKKRSSSSEDGCIVAEQQRHQHGFIEQQTYQLNEKKSNKNKQQKPQSKTA